MPKIDNLVAPSSAVVGRTFTAKESPALAQAKLLGAVIKAAGRKLDKMEVKTETIDYRSTKLPGRVTGATVPIGRGPIESALDGYGELHLDLKNKQFYVAGYKTLGPLKLPEGFSFAQLLTEKGDPKPHTKEQKALVALKGAFDAQIEELYTKPYKDMNWDSDKGTWRKPDGTKLTQVRTDDEKFAMGDKSLFFDLTHKEFWIEQVPGYAGEAWGPFKTPKDFDLKDLVKADKPAAPAKPRRATVAASDTYRSDDTSHRRYAGGGGSDAGYRGPRLGDVVGGRGSNAGSPTFAYFRNRGGGGGGS